MTKYLDLAIANETIKTTDIKGKEYAEVNQRIKAFRMVYPTGFIKTDMTKNENGICVFEAKVGYYNNAIYDDRQFMEEIVLGTGTAYEKEDSTFINKTSYIENCETSAVGRALGMAGFGIDVSVASAEEVQNAIENQKITEEEAKNYTFNFGKYKGKTIEEVLATDKNYIRWMLDNTKDEYFLKSYELVTGEKLPTEEESQERLEMMNKINELVLETNTDFDEIYNHFEVNNMQEMTNKQLKECVKILEKKVLIQVVNEE